MSQNILIILQSHSKGNAPDSQKMRYCEAEKIEVSSRCTASLFNTIEYCKGLKPEIKYKLIIVDDHSDDSFIEYLKNKISKATFECQLIHTEEQGLHPSILKCYKLGKEQGTDLVYFAQDDYLYYESALCEMIDAHEQFSQLTGLNVCIFPYDDPYRYSLLQYSYKVLLGAKRHWRQAFHTASCFMCTHKTIVENWDLFEAMGIGPRSSECEDRSINRLFQNFKELPERKINHLLFSPIPSLALHMGFEGEKDPYLDWKKLWDKFEDARPVTFPKDKKIVLNLGSGKTRITDAIYNEEICDYHEIRVDLDKRYNPDIFSDIKKLPMIPDDSVDAVYSSHSLEHVNFYDGIECLKEWYRVLKKGGELRVIVPNIASAAEHIAKGDIFHVMYESEVGPIQAIDFIYGHKELSRYNDYQCHRMGYTVESLRLLMGLLQYEHMIFTDGMNIILRVRKK